MGALLRVGRERADRRVETVLLGEGVAQPPVRDRLPVGVEASLDLVDGGAHDATVRPAWSSSLAAVIRPMWLNACGKLPSCSPVAVSISSASRPRSFA